MSSSPLDMVSMQVGASEQSSRDLQHQLGNVGNLRGKNISPEARAKKLREACEGFESIFIQKMWQEMRNAVPKGGLLQGREEKFWQDMYDQELSKSMTRAGGIGLADMMYAQLSRSLGDASRTTAAMAPGSAFTPSAAPLLPQQNPESPLADTAAQVADASSKNPVSAPQAMPGIYDGEAPSMAAPAENTQPQSQQPTVQQPVNVQQVQPTAVAQAAAVQPAPVVPPVATHPVPETRKMENRHHSRKASTGHNGDNPLDLVAIARREAGDKLGSRAVRPPLRPHRSAKRQAEAEARQQLLEQQQQPVIADNRPGTANDLQRAMAAARGEQSVAQASATPLADIVARVKASQQNAMAAASQPQINPQAGLQPVPNPLDQPPPLNSRGNPANTAALSGAEETPSVRKVTYSTNIPKNSRATRKGQKDAIRMLNVENTNPNSKAGKGIAAYHAQQAVQQPQPVAAPQAPVPPAGPAPLTARDVAPADEPGAGFAIPPLTPGSAGGQV